MSSRVEVLWRVAELYPDLVCSLNSGSGMAGDGGSVPVLSDELYTPTVREFERLLRVMRDDRTESLIRLEDGSKLSVRKARWHLVEWHLRAEPVIRNLPVTVRRHGKVRTLVGTDGRPVTKPARAMRRHPEAREKLAKAAVAWMASRWGLPTEPMLPKPVIEPIRVAA